MEQNDRTSGIWIPYRMVGMLELDNNVDGGRYTEAMRQRSLRKYGQAYSCFIPFTRDELLAFQHYMHDVEELWLYADPWDVSDNDRRSVRLILERIATQIAGSITQ